ncbi:MAG: hypothetical protein ACPGWM_05215 [Flavobacteriales bacterium]
MEITLGTGIERLIFGSTLEQVQQHIGKPDRHFEDEDDSNLVILQYNKIQVQLTFFKDEGNKLGNISTIQKDLTFAGEKFIGKPIDAVTEWFEKKGVSDEWDREEFQSFTSHFHEQYQLELHEEYGIVTHFEIGVPFKNDDEYAWPSVLSKI